MEYNPEKQYTWKADDKFELNGQEFGLIINIVKSLINTEEAKKFQLLFKANEILENSVKISVENNIAQEIKIQENEN